MNWPSSNWPKLSSALRIGLLVYGVLNAALYSGLLPLWDGFDEPFHYGYVEWLRTQGTLPVLLRTPLPDEVTVSLDYVPTSFAVWSNLHRGILYDSYFALPKAQRQALLERLRLPPTVAPDPPGFNYEAHQAPLAYGLLVPFDQLLAHEPLPDRILRLRLLVSLVAVTLLWFGAFRLAALIQLPPAFSLCAVFVTFSSQMLYATVCRISNDWLALPLWTFLLAAAVEFYLRPRTASGLRLSLWLAAGLLTKAYFLAAVPLVFLLLPLCCLQRKLSWPRAIVLAAVAPVVTAPWYIRNLILYRNLTGMQETAGGVPFGQLTNAALRLPWLRALDTTASTSLWTGNNSLVAFSSKTIYAMLMLLASATLIYIITTLRNRLPRAEFPVVSGTALLIAGLLYSTVLTFWYTHGAGVSPAPWYLQPLLVPGLSLLFMGLSRFQALGRALTLGLLWLWAYVIGATYVAKLVPFYAGFTGGRAHLSDMLTWWGRLFAGTWGTLDTMALFPPQAIITLTVTVVAMAILLAGALSALIVNAGYYSRP